MSKKISVIVPVYNTEKYLDKCLDSLLNQTYKNLEIIVVEDCSTDKSRKALQKYSKNKKIKIVFNDQNKGLSFSRNIGLKNATGDYIGYIDSDDYVDLDFYEKLMDSIVQYKSEIAICDMKVVYEDKNVELVSKCCNFDDFNVVNVINNGLAASACNKLFKKELISKYPFAEGKVNEDIAVIIPALVNSKKISYANTYYYYVQRGGSIQNSGFSDKRFDIFYGVKITLERIKKSKYYDEIKDVLVYNQLIVLLLYVVPKETNFKRRQKILKQFNELSLEYKIRQNHYYWDFLKACGKKHKLYYRLLFKLNCNKLYFLSNLLISLYQFAYKFKKNSVIKDNITLDDLIEKAKFQYNLVKPSVKISVIVPNYNYEKFMEQRIYSILNQNYKIYELIILDDCSKDNSIDKINKIVNAIKDYVNVKTIYNDKNSGSAFKQWKKGMEVATGDYVWIAEADDYCEKNLISTLVKPIEHDKNIMISYSDTAFIDVFGTIILKSIKPEIDIQKSEHWNKSYVNNGIDEIKNYSFLNCTIANVSSCIIKNGNYEEYLKMSGEYKQAGDWLFYVNLISNGDIAYTDKVLNYYRVHGNNVSSTMNHQKHIDEINKIHKFYIEKFNLEDVHKQKMKERIEFLKDVWHLNDELNVKKTMEYKIGYNDCIKKTVKLLKQYNINRDLIMEIKNYEKK